MELSLAKPALLRKPLLLKDYLLDDLSSCSSSGFRSYPRRQCCITVRFLLEIDLKNKPPKYIQKPPHNHKRPSKPPSSSPSSPFQRASTAVINAVKSSSSLSNKLKLTLLPRTLSRKLFRRSFWKRPCRKEIRSCQPTNQLDVKVSPPLSDFTGSPTSGDSRSSTSDSNCKSTTSWSDTDFTATNGNSAVKILNQCRHDVASVENKRLPQQDKVASSRSRRGGVLVGGDYSATEATTSSNGSTSSNNLKVNIISWFFKIFIPSLTKYF